MVMVNRNESLQVGPIVIFQIRFRRPFDHLFSRRVRRSIPIKDVSSYR
uniref:Uncharacterized protein n=1 Tax=Rhizophora mucronata TaxID=61149 RepID=A0A2P2NRV3_RHIMU